MSNKKAESEKTSELQESVEVLVHLLSEGVDLKLALLATGLKLDLMLENEEYAEALYRGFCNFEIAAIRHIAESGDAKTLKEILDEKKSAYSHLFQSDEKTETPVNINQASFYPFMDDETKAYFQNFMQANFRSLIKGDSK